MVLVTRHPYPVTLSLGDIFREEEAWTPMAYRARLALLRATRAVMDQTGLGEDRAAFVAAMTLLRVRVRG